MENKRVFIVGGGLSGGLLAWLLHQRQPELNFTLFEKQGRLGGDHTWSFHETDLPAGGLELLAPFLRKSWVGHQVRFAKYQRTLSNSYHSIRSEDFHNILMDKFGHRVRLRTPIEILSPQEVMHPTGEIETADVVIDARGSDFATVLAGYQKFFGLDLEFEEPHGLRHPVLMDATIEQKDGYRFFYLLPWSDTSCLIEDTYYSNKSEIDVEESKKAIFEYAEKKGWKIKAIEREEIGVLPIPLFSVTSAQEITTIGVRAGLFQWVTGYSLGEALKVALFLSENREWSFRKVQRSLLYWERKRRRQEFLYLVLNRMMFWGANPNTRIRIFERFYRLPEELIQRFYAGRLTWRDALRLFWGRPPIAVKDAITSLVRTMEWNPS